MVTLVFARAAVVAVEASRTLLEALDPTEPVAPMGAEAVEAAATTTTVRRAAAAAAMAVLAAAVAPQETIGPSSVAVTGEMVGLAEVVALASAPISTAAANRGRAALSEEMPTADAAGEVVELSVAPSSMTAVRL
jgi:U3 small nucleolar ribonucleoprotein component